MPFYEYQYHVQRLIDTNSKDAKSQSDNEGSTQQMVNQQMNSAKSMQSSFKAPKFKI